MSAIISGLIGGIVSVVLAAYIARRAGRSVTAGRLSFGFPIWTLALGCLAFASLPVFSIVYADDHREFWVKVALLVGFGVAAIYCFGEAAFVRGTFDDAEIEYFTPWTGLKREKWEDLDSVHFNEWGHWYTLTFKSGRKIRLSRHLRGHLFALEKADVHSRVRWNC